MSNPQPQTQAKAYTGRVTDVEYRRRMDQSRQTLLKPPNPYEDNPQLMYTNDPVEWLEGAVGFHPYDLQQRILRDVVKLPEVAVASCHAAGKSALAAGLALNRTQVRRPCIVVTTAPTDRQVRKVLWREIRKLVNRASADIKGKLLTQELQVHDDVFAVGFTASDSDSFQGFHEAEVYIIVDEASGVSDEIFDAIDGISTGDVHILYISNPLNVTGRFYKLFKSASVKSYTISAFDTPNLRGPGITIADIRSGAWRDKHDALKASGRFIPGLVDAEWVARMYVKYGEESFFWISRVLGQFPDLDENALISMRLIVEAQERIVIPGKDDEVILSCDVARFGDDSTVIYMRHGNRVRLLESFGKKATTHTIGRLKAIFRTLKRCDRIHIDDVGVGGGVTDALVEAGLPVSGIIAGAKAQDPEDYFNVRAEMYDTARKAMPDLDINDEAILAEDLASVHVQAFTSKGQLQLEPKDKQKKRIGRSPDHGDAFALLFAPVRMLASSQYAGGVAGGLRTNGSIRKDLNGFG